MEHIQYEGLLGILSEIIKKVDAIQANSKVKENQSVNQISHLSGVEDKTLSTDGIYSSFTAN